MQDRALYRVQNPKPVRYREIVMNCDVHRTTVKPAGSPSTITSISFDSDKCPWEHRIAVRNYYPGRSNDGRNLRSGLPENHVKAVSRNGAFVRGVNTSRNIFNPHASYDSSILHHRNRKINRGIRAIRKNASSTLGAGTAFGGWMEPVRRLNTGFRGYVTR